MTQEYSPFLRIAAKYRSEVMVILKEGKISRPLRIGNEFKATPRHTVVVATICDTLGKWIGLPEGEQETLNITAVLHDADKRLEYHPDQFTSEESEALVKKMAAMGADPKLMEVTKEGFVDKNINRVNELTLPEMILYYADMIVAWDRIVSFRSRLDESKTRRTQIPEEFFETEFEFGSAIERRLFEHLPAVIKHEVKSPDQIPSFLKTTLGKSAF